MAKAKRTVTTAAVEKTQSMVVAAEGKLEEFAEDLGKLLGSARSKAEGWISQRQAIAKHLEEVRDTATNLLQQLGHEARAVMARRRGRPAGGKRALAAKRGPGRPAGLPPKKKRTMSAEARARISAAQKARWAAQKAGGKKK